MATLVTGGTGFIGSNIVWSLAERGHEVVSLDIEPPHDLVRRTLEPWAAQIRWILGDILDKGTLERIAATEKITKIVHAAAYTPYGDIEKDDIRRVVDINVGGTANLLDLARDLSVERFVFVSSIGVYRGETASSQPLSEDMPLRPQSTYGITKYAGEGLARRYAQLYGFETVSVRLSMVWGPLERPTPYRSRMSLPYDWARRAVRGEPIEASPFGTGLTGGRMFDQEHPYVRDTGACIGIALDAPSLTYPVYNISTGRKLSLHDMISAIQEAHPEVKITQPVPVDDASKGLGYSFDVSRMREDLGFTPKYDQVSGLRDYIKWRQTFDFMD